MQDWRSDVDAGGIGGGGCDDDEHDDDEHDFQQMMVQVEPLRNSCGLIVLQLMEHAFWVPIGDVNGQQE